MPVSEGKAAMKFIGKLGMRRGRTRARRAAGPGLGARLSLRFRILALCGIMVVGFSVIGGVFVWSQTRLSEAFELARQNALLAEEVRDVAILAGELKATHKDYELHPGNAQEGRFNNLLDIAKGRLQRVRELEIATAYRAEIDDALDTLNGIGGAFDTLHTHQQELGYDGDSGLRGAMSTNLSEAERTLKRETIRTRDPLELKLQKSLLDIIAAERGYMLTKMDTFLGDIELGYSRFDRTMPRVELDPAKATIISDGVNAHRAQFEKFSALVVERARTSELLSNLFDLLPPRLNALKTAAEDGTLIAETQLAQTTDMAWKLVISAIGLTAALAVVAGLVVTSSIMRPLHGLRRVMSLLSKGDTNVEIPRYQGGRELVAMAETLHVFRDSLIERRDLEAAQQQEQAARDERARQIDAYISAFEETVEASLSQLNTAAEGLGQASHDVEGAADNVMAQAGSAGQAVEEAARNVSSASAATEQLAMSINEIASQAEGSSKVAARAVEGSRATEQTMTTLSDAAQHIGEAVGLIRDIANQTNLLALNATIEAARAGEHGKGFAVVASEVKSLASQTSQTTEEIAEQVQAIQAASGNAVTAIQEVGNIIKEMNEMSAAVAASVEQQNAAVQSISENVAGATRSSEFSTRAMETVSQASDAARATGSSVSEFADLLSAQADTLRQDVSAFLSKVRAA